VLEFESQGALSSFIISANKYSYVLSDILISHSALSVACETTLTFDKRASRFK
jgi:predicted nucleic-acid-binding protein